MMQHLWPPGKEHPNGTIYSTPVRTFTTAAAAIVAATISLEVKKYPDSGISDGTIQLIATVLNSTGIYTVGKFLLSKTNATPTLTSNDKNLDFFMGDPNSFFVRGDSPYVKDEVWHCRAYISDGGANFIYSDPVSITIEGAPVIPTIPILSNVSNSADNSSISVTISIDDLGGAPLSAVNVYIMEGGGNPILLGVATLEPSITAVGNFTHVFTGLLAGTTYSLCAVATNSAGDGNSPFLALSTTGVDPR